MLRSISLVITPPSVSSPSDSGVTSSSTTPLTSPARTPAWIAAPTATTSSGLTDWFGSLPPVSRRTSACTAGIRVEPPTRITSSMSRSLILASASACLTGPTQRSDQIGRKLLELGSGQLHLQVLRSRCIGGDERQADGGFDGARELDLGLFGCLGQSLQRLAVLAQIDALLALELFGQPIDQPLVEIVAAQMCVAGRRADLEDAIAHVEDRDVERAAAEIEDQDGLVFLLVEPVGERGGRRLVDDPQHVQPGDLAGVFGRLALRIVEVGRDGDHRVGNLLAQVFCGVVRKFAQHLRGDLFRRILLAHDHETHGIVRARRTTL